MHRSIDKVSLQEYLAAEKAFKQAELKLTKGLEAEIKRLIKAEDTDGIQFYIDALPRSCKVVRRLYEALLRIHGVK